MKLPKEIADFRWVVWAGALSGVLIIILSLGLLRGARFATVGAGPVIVILLLLLAIPMAERKNAERRKKSAKNAAAELRSVIGNAPRVASVGVVRDLPELFYYSDVEVDSFGEAGLAKLASTAHGRWVVISETQQYPAYSTLLHAIPNAFPRGLTKLHMPDARDKIYAGWYDPPPDANTHIDWNFRKPLESED